MATNEKIPNPDQNPTKDKAPVEEPETSKKQRSPLTLVPDIKSTTPDIQSTTPDIQSTTPDIKTTAPGGDIQDDGDGGLVIGPTASEAV